MIVRPLLAASGLFNQLQALHLLPNGDCACLYGDSAYPLRPQLQGPFQGARVTHEQEEWNTAMNYFIFLDFKKI
jgi:hypothetical protein